MELTATDKIINQFETRIKELLREGLSITDAVQQAYQEFPVMETMRDEVQRQIVAEASAGYGSALPSSTVAALTEAWAPDGLTLSERTTKGRAGVLNTVINVLRDSRRRGESYKKTALNLFDGYKKGGIIPQQDIPKFMSELFQLSAKEGYKELAYRAQLRRVQYALQRLKTPALRSAYSLLVKAIDARNDQALSKAIYSATQERTRYFAERIARTELRRAYIDGFLAKYQDDSTVLAYRWRMSSAHPVFDICDLHANADLYGLGKGIYPKDKVPLLPAHPHCLCYLMPVRDLGDKEPYDNIEKGGREYLNSLSLRERQRVLGIHGEKDVRAGVSWTAKARGYSGDILKGRLGIGFIGKKYYNKSIEYNGRTAIVLFDKNGKLKVTKAVDADKRHKVSAKSKPNEVSLYWSKGGEKGIKQPNFSIYDTNGDLMVQYHYGHHGMPRKHNFGTKDTPEYLHKHFYSLVDGKLREGEGIKLTEDEKRYLDDY